MIPDMLQITTKLRTMKKSMYDALLSSCNAEVKV